MFAILYFLYTGKTSRVNGSTAMDVLCLLGAEGVGLGLGEKRWEGDRWWSSVIFPFFFVMVDYCYLLLLGVFVFCLLFFLCLFVFFYHHHHHHHHHETPIMTSMFFPNFDFLMWPRVDSGSNYLWNAHIAMHKLRNPLKSGCPDINPARSRRE